MKKILKKVLFEITFLSMTYFGLISNVKGAYNVSIFIITAFFFLTLAMLSDSGRNVIKKSLMEDNLNSKLNSMLSTLMIIGDLAASIAFIWLDHFILGTMLIVSLIISEGVKINIKEELERS
jgi:hypothetical protein